MAAESVDILTGVGVSSAAYKLMRVFLAQVLIYCLVTIFVFWFFLSKYANLELSYFKVILLKSNLQEQLSNAITWFEGFQTPTSYASSN